MAKKPVVMNEKAAQVVYRAQTLDTPEILFDLEGITADFPNTNELVKFVFQETGYNLKIQGRKREFAYGLALATLNGVVPDAKYTDDDNPFVNKENIIPTEDKRELAPKDPNIPDESLARPFHDKLSNTHPLADPRDKMNVVFRNYPNGLTTFEIEGPIVYINSVEVTKNSFGQTVPAYIRCIDPRMEERIIAENGRLNELGRYLHDVYKGDADNAFKWPVFIQRDRVTLRESPKDTFNAIQTMINNQQTANW